MIFVADGSHSSQQCLHRCLRQTDKSRQLHRSFVCSAPPPPSLILAHFSAHARPFSSPCLCEGFNGDLAPPIQLSFPLDGGRWLSSKIVRLFCERPGSESYRRPTSCRRNCGSLSMRSSINRQHAGSYGSINLGWIYHGLFLPRSNCSTRPPKPPMPRKNWIQEGNCKVTSFFKLLLNCIQVRDQIKWDRKNWPARPLDGDFVRHHGVYVSLNRWDFSVLLASKRIDRHPVLDSDQRPFLPVVRKPEQL